MSPVDGLDLVKKHTVLKKHNGNFFSFGFMTFIFYFAFYYILYVKFLSNWQVTVTSLGRCC